MPGQETTPTSREKRCQGNAAQRAAQRLRLRRAATLFLLVLAVALEVRGGIDCLMLPVKMCAGPPNSLPPPPPPPVLLPPAAGVQGGWECIGTATAAR